MRRSWKWERANASISGLPSPLSVFDDEDEDEDDDDERGCRRLGIHRC